MEISMENVLFLLIITLISIIYYIYLIKKMSQSEKEQLKAEWKTPTKALKLSVVIIGIFLFYSGLILKVKLLLIIAFFLSLPHFISTVHEEWKENKSKGRFIYKIGLLTGIVLFIYWY